MKTTRNFLTTGLTAFLLVVAGYTTQAQTYRLDQKASTFKIDGTSNIHDWTIEAEDYSGFVKTEFKNGQLAKIENLELIVRAESLKSGKGGMDKNTYKALKTDKYPKITFTFQDVERIDCISKDKCVVVIKGYLDLAGTRKLISVNTNASLVGNRIILSGEKSLDMTTFNIDPPTALLGTIKTGDTVKIIFETTFSK